MKHDPDVHRRRSFRLRGYDYSAAGAYFVTLCVYGRECLLGDIRNSEMVLNDAGNAVREWWQGVSDHFVNVHLDEFMIMPNHFHGIVVITDAGTEITRPLLKNDETAGITPDSPEYVGAGSPRPLLNSTNMNRGGAILMNQGGETPPLPTLGQIIGYFKYQSTKQTNQMRGNPGCPVWQRNYYERVIRDERELDAARKYILENPIKWDLDRENPTNVPRP
ncbi:transposase [Pelotalea chapellei]|uniref:Transposase IS200-like domain-containing protein n=1 Tax=Pelotalea chapellei TaxID=44671 RepID=A0ABS5U4Y1_9BACT|nr:transposase [Pelotalea chapellei]MBT1070730.1 hypothetical protein [Pelotalea chapellei]